MSPSSSYVVSYIFWRLVAGCCISKKLWSGKCIVFRLILSKHWYKLQDISHTVWNGMIRYDIAFFGQVAQKFFCKPYLKVFTIYLVIVVTSTRFSFIDKQCILQKFKLSVPMYDDKLLSAASWFFFPHTHWLHVANISLQFIKYRTMTVIFQSVQIIDSLFNDCIFLDKDLSLCLLMLPLQTKFIHNFWRK